MLLTKLSWRPSMLAASAMEAAGQPWMKRSCLLHPPPMRQRKTLDKEGTLPMAPLEQRSRVSDPLSLVSEVRHASVDLPQRRAASASPSLSLSWTCLVKRAKTNKDDSDEEEKTDQVGDQDHEEKR
ncbi:hypothetical protein FQN60_016765 [Etheostoma spectabile]|uniref:Uncharacterized protein n=1 Tax=Etheostoma spectabile TaxID=54343 RepID=A0A5J5CD44_9PERO|nr:hypothetical protein FQN60_016765 [Etheostoma spectabile]